MKKLSVLAFLILSSIPVYAARMEAQFRVWKSSYIDGNNELDTMLTSAPVLIHAIDISSPTFGNGGNSYVAMWQSTSEFMTTGISTRIFVATDISSINQPFSPRTFDFQLSSHVFISKQGNSKIIIIWDWLNGGPTYKTPYDGN